MVEVRVQKMNPAAIIPTKATDGAAGFDLYACPDKNAYFAQSGGQIMVHTGIAMEIPKGYFGAIYARSGLSTKHGLRPSNCVGVIDSDYRGEIMVALRNDSMCFQSIQIGERVAQIVIMPCPDVTILECSELSGTVRGECGFGSTGR